MKKFFSFLFILCGINAFSQPVTETSITDLIKEMQQLKKNDQRMQLVWWMTREYWKISFSQTKSVSESTARLIEDAIDDYEIICVADVIIHPEKGFINKDRKAIASDLVFTDSKGKKYFPLTENEISEDAFKIGEYLKPFFAKILGQFGDGLSIYYFKIQDQQGNNLINPRKKDSFIISQGGNNFEWNLPLASLMPSKFCPTDRKKMQGNWDYCPFHGVALSN